MPKVKRSQGGNVTFAVSPWISKATRRQSEGHAPEQKPATQIGRVVRDNHSQGEPVSQASAVAPGREKKRRLSKSQSQDYDESLVTEALDCYSKELESAAAEETERADKRLSLTGKGYLLFYEDGVVRSYGCFLDDNPLEVAGREIRSGRECTRDSDWQLLRLSVVSMRFGHHTLLVGKTGGDAAKLRPLEVHGTEETDMRPHLVGTTANSTLYFDCMTILTDRQAEDILTGAHHREGRCNGLVINHGAFKLSVPHTEHTRAQPRLLHDSDLDG